MIDTTTRHLVDALAMRVFDIQDARERLHIIEEGLKKRIRELEVESIKPHRIIDVGPTFEVSTRDIDEGWSKKDVDE